MEEKNIVLEVQNLTKKFNGKCVVNGISFTAYEGEVIGLLGPNGSGKTTTIKMIVGLLNPNAGTISICGHRIDKEFEAALENVGAIVENPDIYKGLSGRKNIELVANMHEGVTKERIDQVINIVGMQKRIDEKVKRFSLGMKQRIGLAQAIVHKPKLVLLDEPTNGLDPMGIRTLRNVIKQMAKDGSTIIISSHLMSEVEAVSDRVVMIDKGSVVGIQTMESVKNTASANKSFIINVSDKTLATKILAEKPNITVLETEETDAVHIEAEKDDIPVLVKALSENGIAVYEIHRVEGKLEDAFINMMGGNEIE